MAKIYTLNNNIVTINNKWVQVSEEPTPPVPSDEVTIGNQIWKKANYDGEVGTYVTYNNKKYYSRYSWNSIVAANPGWHIPSETEINTLVATVNNNASTLASYGWNVAETLGYMSVYYDEGETTEIYNDTGKQTILTTTTTWIDEDEYRYALSTTNNSITVDSLDLFHWDDSAYYPVRLIKDA